MEQNYSNHVRYVPGYHFILLTIIVLSIIGAIVNLYNSLNDHANLYSASLILVLFVFLLMVFWYMRAFPLKAQDRAIRAEENLRHYIMTGKPHDSRLRTSQIVALRFASDAEFVALSKKAADENLSPDQIKKLITSWKADTHRV